MPFSFHDRMLVGGVLAALTLASAFGCSRSDRAPGNNEPSQSGAVAPADTQTGSTSVQTPTSSDSSANARQDASGYQPMGQDTTGPSVSAAAGKPGERLEQNQTSASANSDSLANQPESDRIRPPEDSSETIGAVTADSAASDTMTRDTTSDVGQVSADTAAVQARVDTTTQQRDTVALTTGDTAAGQAQLDTTSGQPQAEVAVETQQDTTTVVGDSSEVGKPGERLEANAASGEANADSLPADSERIRSPEDSAEVLGNVNDEHANAKAEVNSDVEAVGDAGAEPVGAARVESTGGIVTGEAAVAAVTREGQRCVVVDPEQSPEVRWDVASSPATLNPCGTGTMTLPRIWTGEKK